MHRTTRPLAFLLGVLPVVLLGACAGTPLPRETLQDPSALLFNGYAKDDVACYRCHGGDGRGTGRGPDLHKRVAGLSDAELKKAIEEGPGLMPAYAGRVSPAELDALVAWLRTSFPGPAK